MISILALRIPSREPRFSRWELPTTDFHGVGKTIGIRLNPEDIHIMHKSEYSGMFGDYSSYSAEYDELTEDAEDEEE